MKSMDIISPIELTVISVLISFALILSLDSDELNIIGNVLIGIGGLLVIAALQTDHLADMEAEKAQIEMLKQQLKYLEERKYGRKRGLFGNIHARQARSQTASPK